MMTLSHGGLKVTTRLRSTLLPIAALLVAVATTATARPARADNRTVAREAYKEGTRYFEVGDFQNALEAFKKAYVAYEEPAFLFNMAQCYRLLKNNQEALRAYKLYLRKVPQAPNRDEIERLIQQLEIAIEQERITSTMPPVEPVAPGGKRIARTTDRRPESGTPSRTGTTTTTTTTTTEPGGGATEPGAATEPGTTTEPGSTTTAAAATRPAARKDDAPKPLYKKWWLWVAVGGGVAVIAIAAGAGAAASSRPDFKPTLPDIGPAALEVRF
jgi:tetratricopeptide (TPR) repeat protein